MYQRSNQKPQIDRQYNGQTKKDKMTNNLQQTINKNLKIKQHELHEKRGVNSCAPEGVTVPAPLVTISTGIRN